MSLARAAMSSSPMSSAKSFPRVCQLLRNLIARCCVGSGFDGAQHVASVFVGFDAVAQFLRATFVDWPCQCAPGKFVGGHGLRGTRTSCACDG